MNKLEDKIYKYLVSHYMIKTKKEMAHAIAEITEKKWQIVNIANVCLSRERDKFEKELNELKDENQKNSELSPALLEEDNERYD